MTTCDAVEKCNLWGGHARKWGWSAVCMHAALFFGMPAACLQHACSMPYTEGRLQVSPVRSWAIMCEPGPWWLFRSFSLVELCRPGWMPKDFAGASETWNDQTWNNQTWKPIRVGMITMHAWKFMSFHYMLPSFMFCFFNVTHERDTGIHDTWNSMHAWPRNHACMRLKRHPCMKTKPCMHETATQTCFFPCMHVQAWS